jgi:hypothetical protein
MHQPPVAQPFLPASLHGSMSIVQQPQALDFQPRSFTKPNRYYPYNDTIFESI